MKRNWGHLVLPACFALGLVVGLSVASHFKIDDRGNELDTINTERRVQKLEAAAAQKAFEVARLSALVSAASSHAEVNVESVKLEEKLGRWIEQIESLKRYLRQVPSLSIPEMTYLSPRDWLDATKGKVLQTDADFRRTFAEPRNQAKIIVGQKMANALRAAAAAVDGGDTPSEAVFRRALESAVGE